jgi:glucuronate isomerase
MASLLDPHYLLDTDAARALYRDHAAHLPVYDYCSRVVCRDVIARRCYDTISDLWLDEAPHAARLMRTAGVPESCIGAAADPRERFIAYCGALSRSPGHPLIRRTRLELQRVFGIVGAVDEWRAPALWNELNRQLRHLDAATLLERAGAAGLCVPLDPAHSASDFLYGPAGGIVPRIVPALSLSRVVRIDDPDYRRYLRRLGGTAGVPVQCLGDVLDALNLRVEAFHRVGARSAELACDVDAVPFPERMPNDNEMDSLFALKMSRHRVRGEGLSQFVYGFLVRVAPTLRARGWTVHLRLGAYTGWSYDGRAVPVEGGAEAPLARGLSALFNELRARDAMPRVVVSSAHAGSYNTVATALAALPTAPIAPAMPALSARSSRVGRLPPTVSFESAVRRARTPGGSLPPRVALGVTLHPAVDAVSIERQLRALGAEGMFATSPGATTEASSVTSCVHHDEFRRSVCMTIGRWLESGHGVPDGREVQWVEDICGHNAMRAFGMGEHPVSDGDWTSLISAAMRPATVHAP